MNIRQGIAKCFLTLISLAGVTTTLADPIFLVLSNIHRAQNGNFFMCDLENTAKIQVTAANKDALDLGNINAEIYEDLADVGTVSKALKAYSDVDPTRVSYTVDRRIFNPENEKTVSKTYYVRITPADGSAGSWVEEITFDAIHIKDITAPQFEPYCAGKMPSSVSTFVGKYTSGKYHWYDEDGNALGLWDYMNIGSLGEGDHIYRVAIKDGDCFSKGVELKLSVIGNGAAHLSKSYVNYGPSDIKNGFYTKTILEQALEQHGTELVDNNENNCDLIWRGPDGNVIADFENYIPPVPTKSGSTIDQYTVQKDCGCSTPLKTTTLYLLRYLVPTPTVSDKEFCVGDLQASDGFDAELGLAGEAGESVANYALQFSKNADMSDAVTLSAGETHFNFAFDVTKAGTTTYYVRQQQITDDQYSVVVPFKVVVKQPVAPALTNKSVCANSTQSVELSSISNEAGIIWRDASNSIITGSVSTVERGDIVVSAQKSEIVNGTQCHSEIATATIHVDALNVAISGDNVLLPGETGKSELTITGSGNQTIAWSSNVAGSIIGDADKKDVTVKMGGTPVTLTAVVNDGACSETANWTFQADLFECPSPVADNLEFCINDPRAADGFDAIIKTVDASDNTSHYSLSISKNADMSGAMSLSAGETHFAYPLNVSATGIQTIYIRQTELSRNLSGPIVPMTITVSQPAIPSTTPASLCLNDTKEIQLSQLSSSSNLQWYDADKNELTTVAPIKKKGTHTFYAKRYELVNGDKCWSELASVNVVADSLGMKISGDDHLCPGKDGKVTVSGDGNTTSFDRTTWSCDSPEAISNTASSTVDVTMGIRDLTLSCTVNTGVCQASGTWDISVGTSKVGGKIQFTEGNKARTSSSLDNVTFNSCGNEIVVEATVEHTSSDFTVRKGNTDLGTYSFDGNVARFTISGDGSYSVIYANDCETSFSFNVSVMTASPIVETTKWSSCYGGEISAIISNVDGCKVTWYRDEEEVVKDTKTLRISNVSASDIGEYTYTLLCDGCSFIGFVSDRDPDIYPPLNIAISQSADTICQGDVVEVDIEISPNSDKVSYSWSTGNDIVTANKGASATLKPYTSQSYNVVIRNGDCAQQLKTVDVNVHPQMNGNIEAGTIMCEGDSTTLDASALEAERYDWEHDHSNSAIITVVPNGVENKYYVTAYRGKCILEKEFVLMVGATPKLASVDSIGLDDVQINMSSAGEYQFIVDGKSTAKDVTDNVKYNLGFGKHTLSIIDIAGCKTDTTFVITEPEFVIQNFIEPDSDGDNATLKIPDAVKIYPNTTMRIYNRHGKLLTTLKASNDDEWDGTYNGIAMPSSDYWYELSIDAIDKVYFGHFTLLR